MRVVALFHSPIVDLYNDQLAIVGLRATSPWRHAGAMSGVELTLAHRDRAGVVARALARDLGNERFVVETWDELSHSLFTVFEDTHRVRAAMIATSVAFGLPGCR